MNTITKPYLYTVIYKDKKDNFKHKYTNDENTALNWKCRYNGEIYIDTRYKAKLRLYYYLWRKNEYSK